MADGPLFSRQVVGLDPEEAPGDCEHPGVPEIARILEDLSLIHDAPDVRIKCARCLSVDQSILGVCDTRFEDVIVLVVEEPPLVCGAFTFAREFGLPVQAPTGAVVEREGSVGLVQRHPIHVPVPIVGASGELLVPLEEDHDLGHPCVDAFGGGLRGESSFAAALAVVGEKSHI